MGGLVALRQHQNDCSSSVLLDVKGVVKEHVREGVMEDVMK